MFAKFVSRCLPVVRRVSQQHHLIPSTNGVETKPAPDGKGTGGLKNAEETKQGETQTTTECKVESTDTNTGEDKIDSSKSIQQMYLDGLDGV